MSVLNRIWLDTLAELLHFGQTVSPRDHGTLELLGVRHVLDMSMPVLTVPERKISYRFMAAEASWILHGENRLSEIAAYAPSMKRFANSCGFLSGAYGPKVVEQLGYVVDVLVKDQNTRQAVINIWRERPRQDADIPCTLSLQFLLRNNFLHVAATMRSSDIWLGFPYDVFSFTSVAMGVALLLKEQLEAPIELGRLFLTVGSQHLYDTNKKAAEEIISSSLLPSYCVSWPAVRDFRNFSAWLDFLRAKKDDQRGVKDFLWDFTGVGHDSNVLDV